MDGWIFEKKWLKFFPSSLWSQPTFTTSGKRKQQNINGWRSVWVCFFLKLKGKQKTKKGSQNYSNSADVTRMDWSRLLLSSSMPWGSCWKGSIHRTKVLKEAPSNQKKTVVTLLSQATRFGNTNQQNALEFLIMSICRWGWGGSSK